MHKPKLIIFLATLLVVLGITLLVSFLANPGPEIIVGSGEGGTILSNLDQIPDRILPHLAETNIPLYVFWREVCHLVATCALIGISFFFFRYKKYYYAPTVVFVTLLIWVTYQEVYLHPLHYHQEIWNGVLDWCVWIVPFGVFLILINLPRKRISAFH